MREEQGREDSNQGLLFLEPSDSLFLQAYGKRGVLTEENKRIMSNKMRARKR